MPEQTDTLIFNTPVTPISALGQRVASVLDEMRNHRHGGHDLTQRLDQNQHFLLYRILDKTTAASVATTVGGDVELPFGGVVVDAGAFVDTAGTTNTLTVDINKNGTTILNTKITIDSTEKSSRTATTNKALAESSASFIAGDLFTFDIDAIHTTPSQGLTVWMKLLDTTTN